MAKVKHGMCGTRFYRIRCHLYERCNNKNNKNFNRYGGRGIKCEWNSFEEFKNDMLESYEEHCKVYGIKQTTIDRINNDGNYCKENCKRATIKEQANNQSTSWINKYGYTAKEIAVKYGYTEKSVKSFFHNKFNGDFYKMIDYFNSNPKINIDTYKGLSANQRALKLGIGHTSIYKYMKKHKCSIEEYVNYYLNNRKVKTYKGKTLPERSRYFGLRNQTITTYIRKHKCSLGEAINFYINKYNKLGQKQKSKEFSC